MSAPICRGAGQEVPLRALPSSLVTCPACGRRNLGAVRTGRGRDGVLIGIVPPHRSAPPSVEDAVRATEASRRIMATDDGWSTWAEADTILDRQWAPEPLVPFMGKGRRR